MPQLDPTLDEDLQQRLQDAGHQLGGAPRALRRDVNPERH
jgi:hypothetical protein